MDRKRTHAGDDRCGGQKGHSRRTVERIEAAFPAHLSGDVRAVLQLVPKAEHEPTANDVIKVSLQNDSIRIPYRVYFPEPRAEILTALGAQPRLILAAILSRHHNGFVRERWLREIASSPEPWIPPFVVQLLGEYVIEIARAIEDVIPPGLDSYRTFASANPDYCRRVSARMINYWALYHRRQVPSFADYPAYRAASRLGVWRERQPRSGGRQIAR